MERIEAPRNPLGITVYVVGSPDIENMPDEEYDLFASSLELQINEYFNAPKEKKRSFQNADVSPYSYKTSARKGCMGG